MNDDSQRAEKLLAILPYLNEKQRRLVLAADAYSLGYGDISRVSRATDVSRPTIHQALRELEKDIRSVTAWSLSHYMRMATVFRQMSRV